MGSHLRIGGSRVCEDSGDSGDLVSMVVWGL